MGLSYLVAAGLQTMAWDAALALLQAGRASGL